MRHDKRRLKNLCFKRVCEASALFAATAALLIGGFIFAGALPVMRLKGAELFGRLWQPQSGSYGIANMLSASAAAAILSAIPSAAISALAAAWLLNYSPAALKSAVERLCAVISSIPSVIFGLWGLVTVIPLMQRLFPIKTAQSGGASLLSAAVMLTVIQLPMMLPESISAISHAKSRFDDASSALGAEKLQTVFLSQLFHARKGIAAGFLAGIRLSFCETMAVQFLSGNVVSPPEIFGSVRLLGAGLMLEMGYAEGIHRSALFFIGLILLTIALMTELLFGKGKKG